MASPSAEIDAVLLTAAVYPTALLSCSTATEIGPAAADKADLHGTRATPPFPGYHLYYPSRRQHSSGFAAVIDALRYRIEA